MAISLASLKKTTAKANPFVIVSGVEGVGKTEFAAQWPAPIMIRTTGENVPAGVEIDEFPEAASFDDLTDAIAALYNEEHNFGTFIVDALDGVEKLVWAETCKRNGWKTIEDESYGKGYVAADAVWDELLEGLKMLNEEKKMNVLVLSHVEISNFKDPMRDAYDRYQPKVDKRVASVLRSAADIICFLNFRVTIKTEKGSFGKEEKRAEGGGLRVIYLEEKPGFIAKNRYGMPAEVPYSKGTGYDAVVKYLPGAA